jgi:HEAT repeat protein
LKTGPTYDDWGNERVNILTAIGKVDPAGVPEAVAGLREMLRRPKTYSAMSVVSALRKFGPAAGPAVPELIEYGRAGAVGTPRTDLARTFAAIGPAAKAAEPLLKEWAKDEDEYLREAAADALARIAGR